MMATEQPVFIDDQIKTRDGFTFIVVDITEDYDGDPEYVVRSDLAGNDWATRGGVEGTDWAYVYVPAAEATRV